MSVKRFLCCALLWGFVAPLPAAIIGTNIHAAPLTSERLTALPAARQPPWKDYLAHSARQFQADQAFLQKEMKKHGIKESLLAPAGRPARSLLPKRDADWYGQPEARRIADIIVSFQTPAGGWGKNLDMTRSARAPGQRFAPDNGSRYLGKFDNDQPRDANWNYVGTFDNDATTTQLRFLAGVITAPGDKPDAACRKSFLRGLDYIFAAQYPNGGWPQVWPLEGRYHDAITYNDGAMLHVLELLRDVAEGTNDFAFVPARTRTKAAASLQRGIQCLLATQIVVDGRRTVWGQQHDPLTLQPTSARNYEMPSQTSSESADIVLFLMQMPGPDSNIVAAVDAAAAWFDKTKTNGVAFKWTDSDGRRLVPMPGNGPIWARYYEIGTDRPIFGDRDQSIHDDVDEISGERRNGYGWFSSTPQRVLALYPLWRKTRAR
jgi:PelA/Pel-15E family pectate lyase